MSSMIKHCVKEAIFMLLGLLGGLKCWMAKSDRCNIYIIGDLYSESGLGNITRALIASLGGDANYKLINLPLSVGSQQGSYDFSKHVVKKLGAGVNVFVGNPSIIVQALLKLNLRYLVANYTIGVWFWELEKIPADWVKVGKLVNEVWAQSDFSAKAFGESNPVSKVMPFALAYKREKVFGRGYFAIPDDRFVFLMTFDYLSHVARKNPSAVIQAFLDEFDDDPSVMLVIKSVNGDRCVVSDEALLVKARASENIKFIDDYLTKDEMLSLIEVANCYISLHRSEGLGLGMAEAMSLGTLAIATGYSGNLQFMRPDNSLLVGYTLVPVKAGQYPYAKGNVWAEPSIESARAQMRYALTHQVECNALVSQAKSDLEHYDLTCQRAWLKRNLG